VGKTLDKNEFYAKLSVKITDNHKNCFVIGQSCRWRDLISTLGGSMKKNLILSVLALTALALGALFIMFGCEDPNQETPPAEVTAQLISTTNIKVNGSFSGAKVDFNDTNATIAAVSALAVKKSDDTETSVTVSVAADKTVTFSEQTLTAASYYFIIPKTSITPGSGYKVDEDVKVTFSVTAPSATAVIGSSSIALTGTSTTSITLTLTGAKFSTSATSTTVATALAGALTATGFVFTAADGSTAGNVSVAVTTTDFNLAVAVVTFTLKHQTAAAIASTTDGKLKFTTGLKGLLTPDSGYALPANDADGPTFTISAVAS
jgi:hypothetical protein